MDFQYPGLCSYRRLLASVDSSKAWNNLAMCLFAQEVNLTSLNCTDVVAGLQQSIGLFKGLAGAGFFGLETPIQHGLLLPSFRTILDCCVSF